MNNYHIFSDYFEGRIKGMMSVEKNKTILLQVIYFTKMKLESAANRTYIERRVSIKLKISQPERIFCILTTYSALIFYYYYFILY